MNRRLIFVVMVLAFVGGLARLLFNDRRGHQLAHQLREDATRFHAEPNKCLDGHVADLSFDDMMACAWSDGGLPDGLEAGTTGAVDWRTAEAWLKEAQRELASEAPTAQRCLDAARFSAFLAAHGGGHGARYGGWLMVLALPPCAQTRPTAAELDRFKLARGELVHQLPAVMTGVVIDGQVRRFGSWLSPEERQALPSGMRELAAAAPAPPFNPVERNSRLAIWARAQRVGKQLVELDAMPEAAADSLIATDVGEWPERVSDPKKVRDAYDEERLRENAIVLLYDAWALGPRCALGAEATSTVKLDGSDCLLSNGKLHVQLPSRSE